VLVSGSGGGIGQAIVGRLTSEGATVVGADLTGGDIDCDVTSMDSCHAAVMSTLDRYGRLDVLCNVAGIGSAHAIGSFPLTEWRRIFDINVHGALQLSQAALPALLESQGCIVNLASVSALRGSPYNAGYAASKAALISLTRSMAVELASSGVRVNAVAPDVTQTPQVDYARWVAPEDEHRWSTWVPVGRVGTPEETADVVLFLTSDLSRFVTGQVIATDGGTLTAGGWFRSLEGRWTNRPRDP